MNEAERYRELAQRCRDLAKERSLEWEKKTLLGAAEEFERLAREEEEKQRRCNESAQRALASGPDAETRRIAQPGPQAR